MQPGRRRGEGITEIDTNAEERQRGVKRVSESSCVRERTPLSPREADVLYLPGSRRPLPQKGFFSQVRPPPSFLTRLLLPLWPPFEIEAETEISRAHAHGGCEACVRGSAAFSHASPQAPPLARGHSEATLEICHLKKKRRVKRASAAIDRLVPPLLLPCYVWHPLSEPRQPQTH